MMNNATRIEGEASSSNSQPNGAAPPSSQGGETTGAPSQGKGRGRGKKRWAPLEVPQTAYAPQGIPSYQANRPPRQQRGGNAPRQYGNRQGLGYQQRNAEPRVAAPVSIPPQGIQPPVRGSRFVPGATWATPAVVPPQLRDNQVVASGSGSPSSQALVTSQNNQPHPAPSGKKNRRQRGRGKNADASAKSVKKTTTFLDLPLELRERIMTEAYNMTLAELPNSHPKINNDYVDLSTGAIRARRPAPITVLRNRIPPAGLTKKQLKGFLWRNPGQWGPVFQVMYVCDQLYKEARVIRYRHIRVDAWLIGYDAVSNNDNLLMDRLSHEAIREHTKEVIVSFAYLQDTITIKNLVAALKKLKALKHLCIVVKGDHSYVIGQRPGSDADLLLFFGLDLESLTIKWDWAGLNPDGREPDQSWSNGVEYTSTIAEMAMWGVSDNWIKGTLKNSPWYKEYEPFAANRIDLANPNVLENTDKVMKHVMGGSQNQFYFAPPEDRKLTQPPVWHAELKNPHNHASQKQSTP